MLCKYSDKCHLWENCITPKLSYEGTKYSPDLLVIGEAPREEDDITGLVMAASDSGEFLRNTIREAGFDMEKVAFTYVIKCRPFSTKTNKWNKQYSVNRDPSSVELNCCKCYALAEIQVYKPKMVLLLGTQALKGILNETGITSKRGRVFTVDKLNYIPTFSPDMAYKDESYSVDFVKDIKFAYKVFKEGLPEAKKVNYILCDTKYKLVKLLRYASNQRELSFDCETCELSAFNDKSKIVSVSFSFIEQESWVVPLYSKYQLLFGDDLTFAKQVIKVILESDLPKIAQNGKYDIQYLEMTEGIYVENYIADTMLMHHCLSETGGTSNLNYLTWKYVPECGDYWVKLDEYKSKNKEADPERGGSYGNIPWDILFPYTASDTDLCLRIYHILKPQLENLS